MNLLVLVDLIVFVDSILKSRSQHPKNLIQEYVLDQSIINTTMLFVFILSRLSKSVKELLKLRAKTFKLITWYTLLLTMRDLIGVHSGLS